MKIDFDFYLRHFILGTFLTNACLFLIADLKMVRITTTLQIIRVKINRKNALASSALTWSVLLGIPSSSLILLHLKQ